ncbi:helix-turn-helix domain-containing protein [Pseudosulfitobacter pseudonitzschiae]|nr:helix-turn-helix domain-containing protein [Pseudosulfitobacter pseudonitzschiae]
MVTTSMSHTVKPAHERLKMELRLRGKSIASVARELEVLRSTVTLVSQGLRRSSKIEKALANAVETTPAELFPDRYPAEEDRAARKT